jgi:hypothetical protein
MEKMKIIKIILIILAIVLGWFIILYRGSFSNVFSSCLNSEKILPIPNVLKDKEITFSSPMEYVIGLNEEYGYCTPTEIQLGVVLKPNESGGYEGFNAHNFKNGEINVRQVPKIETFKIVGVLSISPNSLITDAGVYITFIVEDHTGFKSEIPSVYFSRYLGDPHYVENGETLILPVDYK